MKIDTLIKLLIVSILISSQILVIDFFKYPEAYLSTWKYQLQQDIKRGNPEAIEYYQTKYLDNGRVLFND